MRQSWKGLLVDWRNIEFFAVLPAQRGLLYAATPAFWHNLESPRWFLVSKPLYFSYYSGLLARDDTSLASLVHCLAMLGLVLLTIGAFFWESLPWRFIKV